MSNEVTQKQDGCTDIEKAVIEHYNTTYRGVSNQEFGLELALKTHLNEDDANMHLELVKDYISLKDKKILDVGSGFGCFIKAALKRGYNVFGAEVDDLMWQTSRKRLALEGFDEEAIKKSEINTLPYEDGFFDVATFFNVLEHVDNIQVLLTESHRVLKKDGQLFIWGPNYLCLYEPHYEMYLIPILPRAIAKLYLKMRGKKVEFLDTLNFAKPWYLERVMQQLDMKIDNVGLKEWKTDLKTLNSKYRTRAGTNVLKLIKKLHLTKLASYMGNFGFYYPLKYIATKK
jgi:2-polyprenyl-3-methyl-5-hydroxy-6-metoxy-1,4-benzoquinol methylase